jgi:hypothetical protein
MPKRIFATVIFERESLLRKIEMTKFLFLPKRINLVMAPLVDYLSKKMASERMPKREEEA